MGENRLTIDTNSFSDDGDSEVEFRGEVDGETHRFAVRYSVLEALSGAPVTGGAATIAQANRDALATAALVALVRAGAEEPVVVSEADLDQPGPEADGFIDDRGSEVEAHPS